MPLHLYAPSARSKYWVVRGTHRGVRFQRTTGETARTEAEKWRKKWQREIDSGALSDKPRLSFAEAALAYERSNHDGRFLRPILMHFGPKIAAADIDQATIDLAAHAILPNAAPSTRNRQVYTPIAAVLHHNGIVLDLKRPKGAQGTRRTTWLRPEQFEAVATAAFDLDAELGAMMVMLCYTGMRLGEALVIHCDQVDLPAATITLHEGQTKTGQGRAVHLPPRVVAALANHPRGLDRPGRVFRFTKNGALNEKARAAYDRAKVSCGTAPFHVLRHTWATWMVRLGVDLVSTGAWKSATSARGYTHFVTTEEARKADALPGASRAQLVLATCCTKTRE